MQLRSKPYGSACLKYDISHTIPTARVVRRCCVTAEPFFEIPLRSVVNSMNLTITVPEGIKNHGNPNLLCTPAQWHEITLFLFANYFAHAASVITAPGQSITTSAYLILLALFLPASGIVRAISAILRHAATETKNPLRHASRANALCMVLKKSDYGNFSDELKERKEFRSLWGQPHGAW